MDEQTTDAKQLTIENNKEIEFEKQKRSFSGNMALLITIIAVAASVFHIYALGIKATSVLVIRTVHLMFGFILIPLVYPGFKKHMDKVHVIDVFLVIIGICVSVYVLLQDHSFVLRAGVNPTKGDILFGGLAIVLILEITRRVIGWPLVIVTLFFLFYARYAIYFPGIFLGKSYKLTQIISYTFNVDGIYGIPIGVSSTYVLLFILFGEFLKKSGAGEFYTDFAYSIAGRTRGGPAKVAIISSALFGTISGSGIANVVTTGTITIPLMKRTGFRGYFAGAVEAVASTGGQIMPPIMGAGAFLMAEIIGVPYSKIIIAAALPALLYFISVFFVVDFQAGKRGLVGLSASELPDLRYVFASKGHLIIPLLILIYSLLVSKSTPIKAALLSMASIIIVSYLKRDTRMDFNKIIKSLEGGALGVLEVVSACACAGIIMALVALTGLGLKLSTFIIELSGSNLFLALLFTALIVVILSMGLPTTACYLISATILGPALTKMGISPIQAHLFIFYYACLSGITPPVALTAYPAGAIAKANPVKVSLTAFSIGIVGFLVPFMFIYSPALLLIGDFNKVIIAVVTSIIAACLIAVSIVGWFNSNINMISRICIFMGGILMLMPGFKTDLVGIALVAGGVVVNKTIFKSKSVKT